MEINTRKSNNYITIPQNKKMCNTALETQKNNNYRSYLQQDKIKDNPLDANVKSSTQPYQNEFFNDKNSSTLKHARTTGNKYEITINGICF